MKKISGLSGSYIQKNIYLYIKKASQEGGLIVFGDPFLLFILRLIIKRNNLAL